MTALGWLSSWSGVEVTAGFIKKVVAKDTFYRMS
jgi:hypothetical protein